MTLSEKAIEAIEKNGMTVAGILLLMVGTAVYFEFLTFQTFFVAQDIAGDQLRYYLPRYMFQADRFRSLDFSMWSFQFGLGQNIYELITQLNPFDRLLILFGRDGLLYALPYIALLKHVILGILFYAYLRLVRISPYVAVIGSLLAGFSGYMVVQGQWYRHQDYAIFMVACLIAFEVWFQKGKWIWLPLVLGLLCLKQILTIYHLPFVLGIYVLFRYCQTHVFSWKSLLALYVKLGLICLVGIGINAFELLPSIYHHLTSPRGSKGLSQIVSISTFISFFDLSTAHDYLSVLYRLFSSDLMGSMNAYRGIINTLEGPNVYVGLVSLLLIPQASFLYSGKRALPYWILCGFLVCYFVFPSVKMLLNAFVKYTYKSTILYAVLFMLIITASALDGMYKKRKLSTRGIWIAGAVFYIFLIASHVVYSFLKIPVFDGNALAVVLLFLFLYGYIFHLLNKYRFRATIKLFLFGFVIVEALLFSHRSIHSNRSHIDASYIAAKQGFFDDSHAAIASLKTNTSRFFRVEKDYVSDSLNDPLIQNYYGTTVYGPFGQSSVIKFVKAFDGVMINDKWIFGFKHQPGIMSLVGVKYFLSKSKRTVPYGFYPASRYNDIHVYENRFALPLGFAYDTYIPHDEFLSLSSRQKERVVSKAVVADNRPAGMKKLDADAFATRFSEQTIPLSQEDITATRLFSGENKDRRLPSYRFLTRESSLAIDLGDKEIGERVFIHLTLESRFSGYGRISPEYRYTGPEGMETNPVRFRVKQGRSDYRIEVTHGTKQIGSLRLDFPDNRGEEIRVVDIDLKTMNLTSGYAEDIAALKADSLNLVSFEEDHIVGTISLDTEKMLFVSIPYDEGWTIRVNGTDVRPVILNTGFMGIPLSRGDHSIELTFTPHLMWISIFISILCLCLVVAVHRIYPRLPAVAFDSYLPDIQAGSSDAPDTERTLNG